MGENKDQNEQDKVKITPMFMMTIEGLGINKPMKGVCNVQICIRPGKITIYEASIIVAKVQEKPFFYASRN